MAEDNQPTGGSSGGGFNYPGSSGDPFKDLFGGGNPTMGGNPTQAPNTSNGMSSGTSGGSSASGDGGGMSSNSSTADSGGADAASQSNSAPSSSSSSAQSSTSGISSASDTSSSADNGAGMGGGGSWSNDGMSITGGGAPDGRQSYTDTASGGIGSSSGPIDGIGGIDGSQRAPVSLSSSIGSGVDEFGQLRDALGIGGQPFPGATGTNFGTAMRDPNAATPAASWAGLDAPPEDSIVDMGSPYNNPFRSPVGTLADNLPQGITTASAPKTQDRVPQSPDYADSMYGDAALSDITPTFDGQPVASNVPAAPDFNVLSGLSVPPATGSIMAQNNLGAPQKPGTEMAMNGPTPPGWKTQTAAEAYDPLAEIKAALGIGAPPSTDVAEIPQPVDPLQAIKTALAIPGANKNLAGGNVMVAGQEWRPLGKSRSLMTSVPQQDLPVDPRVGLPNAGFPAEPNIEPAADYPFSKYATDALPPGYVDHYFPGGLAGTVENVPPEGASKSNEIQVSQQPQTTSDGEVTVADLPDQTATPAPAPSDTPAPDLAQSPTQGKTGSVSPNQQPAGPSTTTGSILGGIVNALTRGTLGDKVEHDFNDYASMTPEEKQAWQDRRNAEQRIADRRDGGGARDEADQNAPHTDPKVDELNKMIAELQAELNRRKIAAKRGGRQYGIIKSTYA